MRFQSLYVTLRAAHGCWLGNPQHDVGRIESGLSEILWYHTVTFLGI
jgi:hypothetical protein